MRINFHEIKSIVSDKRDFKEYFYGMSEYVHGLISNKIKFENPILQMKLYFSTKANNKLKFENDKILAIFIALFKAKENTVNFNNSQIRSRIIERIKQKSISEIRFYNNAISTKIRFSISPKNQFNIKNNTPKTDVILGVKPDKNDIAVNNKIHPTVTLISQLEENDVAFKNTDVNATASYFMRLEAMSGSLNAYYNQTINDTGRKKIL